MTTLCLCDVNEHDLRVFAEIATARRLTECTSATAEANRVAHGQATASDWAFVEPERGA